jgi:hypothetical protein
MTEKVFVFNPLLFDEQWCPPTVIFAFLSFFLSVFVFFLCLPSFSFSLSSFLFLSFLVNLPLSPFIFPLLSFIHHFG